MHKRHIGEFAKSGLANSGRAAGMGMLHDDYSDESGLERHVERGNPVGIASREKLAKREREEAPVKRYVISKDAAKRL